MAVPSRFGSKLTIDVRGIYYDDTLSKKEAIGNARYFKVPKSLTNMWQGNSQRNSVYLMIAMLLLMLRLKKIEPTDAF